MNEPRDRVYFVVRAGTCDELIAAVSDMIKRGWETAGGVLFVGGFNEGWMQALIRRQPQQYKRHEADIAAGKPLGIPLQDTVVS